MAGTSLVCSNCGEDVVSLPGLPAAGMFLNYSHPLVGRGGLYYCIANGCADNVLDTLPGVPDRG